MENIHNKISRSCPLCRQGMQEILKELSSGTLYICCDECDLEWPNPEDALADIHRSRDKYGRSVDATPEEIKAAGWNKYLIDY